MRIIVHRGSFCDPLLWKPPFMETLRLDSGVLRYSKRFDSKPVCISGVAKALDPNHRVVGDSFSSEVPQGQILKEAPRRHSS